MVVVVLVVVVTAEVAGWQRWRRWQGESGRGDVERAARQRGVVMAVIGVFHRERTGNGRKARAFLYREERKERRRRQQKGQVFAQVGVVDGSPQI